jgi:hypothetical protein
MAGCDRRDKEPDVWWIWERGDEHFKQLLRSSFDYDLQWTRDVYRGSQ